MSIIRRCGMYIQWNITQPSKRTKVVILSKVSQTQKDKYHNIAYMWTLKQVQMMNLTYKTEIGSQMQKTNLWLLGDKCKG